VLAGALVSPLCNLAVALFGARVAQHLLVTLVAAPLLATAVAHRGAVRGPIPAAAGFAALFWLWHLPGPYAASFHPDGIAWWWMHGTLALSATWLWAAILGAPRERPVGTVLAGLVTGLQMGALGALLTFAPHPLYAPHAPDVTLPWGLTPLEDQQLGGLLMWVPGGLLFAAVMVATLAALLRVPPAAGHAPS
jgi:putative membrane protein